jgi:hypothetical protein
MRCGACNGWYLGDTHEGVWVQIAAASLIAFFYFIKGGGGSCTPGGYLPHQNIHIYFEI